MNPRSIISVSFIHPVLCTLLCLIPPGCLLEQTSQTRTSLIVKNSSGVDLDPYIRPEPISSDWTCQETDVKVMLEVISTRFSHVANQWYIVDGGNVRCSDFIPILSAKLNREANSTKLTVMLYTGRQGEQIDIQVNSGIKDMELTRLYAISANNIHPNTVFSIVLTAKFSILDNNVTHFTAIKILEHFRFKPETTVMEEIPVKIGVSLQFPDCKAESEDIPSNLQSLLELVDVLVFRHQPNPLQYHLGPLIASQQVTKSFKTCMDKIHQSTPTKTVSVIFQPEWLKIEESPHNTVTNRAAYYKLISEWAAKENTIVYFVSAFDAPHQADPAEREVGWWRLRRNERDTGNITKSSFEEKVLYPRSSEEETTQYSTNGITYPVLSDSPISLILIVSVAVVGLLLVIGGVTLAFVYKKLKQRLSNEEVEEFMIGSQSSHINMDVGLEIGMLRVPYDKKVELTKNSFSIDYSKLLGAGQFGCVFLGSIRGLSEKVAFKVSSEATSKTMLKSLLSEIKVMSFVGSHDFIVNFVGAYTAEIQNGVLYVATELCEEGSLEKYLRSQTVHGGESSSEETIGQSDMLRWSFQIASGMEYIASKMVVHADLATRNVLLTSNLTAKISDFGLSRRLYNYTNYYIKKQHEPLPWRWMSIEALKFLRFTEKSDVWAFGCTMWEIYSLGTVPYPGVSFSSQFVDDLEQGYRLQCPSEVSQEIYDLMSKCWIQNIAERTSFAQLRSKLGSLLNENDADVYLQL